MTNAISYQRDSSLINKKFYEYLTPSMLTSAATSLTFFLDSLVVAQTLGSYAMSLVNMASPITFIISAIFTLFGEGGAVVYAYLRGKMQTNLAKKILSLTLVTVITLSLIVSFCGILFSENIVLLLSSGLEVSEEFNSYIRVVLLSSVIIIPLQTMLTFYPAEGLPQVATIVNVTINVCNIVFDIVFTTWIPLGLKGCAYATLTGYLIGLLIVVICFFIPKYRLPFEFHYQNSLS